MFLVEFDKIRQKHTDVISFIPVIASTSGSLHSECVCLLVQSYGREKAGTTSVGVGLRKKPTDLSANLSTRLIVGKVGSGMWWVKFNSTSNVLVCETQRKVNMYGCVSE
jgi:hypothetical protein